MCSSSVMFLQCSSRDLQPKGFSGVSLVDATGLPWTIQGKIPLVFLLSLYFLYSSFQTSNPQGNLVGVTSRNYPETLVWSGYQKVMFVHFVVQPFWIYIYILWCRRYMWPGQSLRNLVDQGLISQWSIIVLKLCEFGDWFWPKPHLHNMECVPSVLIGSK